MILRIFATCLLFLSACSAPPHEEAVPMMDGALFTRLAGRDLHSTFWKLEGEELVATAQARWDDDHGTVTLALLGRPRRLAHAPAYRGEMSPRLWHAILGTALPEGTRCDDDACGRTWTRWEDDPHLPTLPGPAGEERSRELLAIDLAAAGEARSAIASCAPFPRYQGDQVCSGWVGRTFTPSGVRDVNPCCQAHDNCFFECPLDESGRCRGTECIAACNAALGACCLEHGGAELECGTYEVVTNLGGGGGRNGCGKAKAQSFCEEQEFGSSCATDRCVCEECNTLFDAGFACETCACEDECSMDDAPTCTTAGSQHLIRRCAPAPFGDGECLKLKDEPCLPGEICRPDDDGTPRCQAAECPFAEPCSSEGETEARCRVDDVGPYYRVCYADTDGCFTWKREYCTHDGATACVVLDDEPVCSSPRD